MKGDYSKERKRAPIVVAVILIAAVVIILCIRLLGAPSSDSNGQMQKGVSDKETVSENKDPKQDVSDQQNVSDKGSASESEVSKQDDSASAKEEVDQKQAEEKTKDLQKTDLTVYAQTVRQYDQNYGPLTFYEGTDITNYTGVFLIEPVDFDRNGVKELVIGYAVSHPDGPQYCTWPALDVWTIRDGKPVRLYEGACVSTGDIVRQSGHISLNGKDYIMTGHSGAGTDLRLLELKNGSFTEGAVLKAPEDSDEYFWNGQSITGEQFIKINDQIYSQNIYYASVTDNDPYTAEDMTSALNKARAELGLDQVSPKTETMSQ